MKNVNKTGLARVFVLTLLVLGLLYGSIFAANGITISLDLPETAWSDSRLGEKIDMYLSGINRVPITRFGPVDNQAPIGVESSFQELLEFGRQQGDRFLVDIRIDRSGKKKNNYPALCLF